MRRRAVEAYAGGAGRFDIHMKPSNLKLIVTQVTLKERREARV